MVNKELYEQAEIMMMQYTSLHHMRNTHERRKILEYVVKQKTRFTATQIINMVKKDFISAATVYNTLRLLETAHVVFRLHRQDAAQEMEYEFSLKDHSTMTIICSKCGRVQRVNDKSTHIALDRKIYPNFIMHHYSIYLFGECRRCKIK